MGDPPWFVPLLFLTEVLSGLFSFRPGSPFWADALRFLFLWPVLLVGLAGPGLIVLQYGISSGYYPSSVSWLDDGTSAMLYGTQPVWVWAAAGAACAVALGFYVPLALQRKWGAFGGAFVAVQVFVWGFWVAAVVHITRTSQAYSAAMPPAVARLVGQADRQISDLAAQREKLQGRLNLLTIRRTELASRGLKQAAARAEEIETRVKRCLSDLDHARTTLMEKAETVRLQAELGGSERAKLETGLQQSLDAADAVLRRAQEEISAGP